MHIHAILDPLTVKSSHPPATNQELYLVFFKQLSIPFEAPMQQETAVLSPAHNDNDTLTDTRCYNFSYHIQTVLLNNGLGMRYGSLLTTLQFNSDSDSYTLQFSSYSFEFLTAHFAFLLLHLVYDSIINKLDVGCKSTQSVFPIPL